MKKITEKIAFATYVITISAVFALCIVFAPQITACTNPLPTRTSYECFGVSAITPASIKLNSGYYNISIAMSTGDAPTVLQKFFIYPWEDTLPLNKTTPGMLVYFNGTAQNPSMLNCTLNRNSNLQVNCLIPETEYAPNTNMSMTIYTAQAMYCTEFSLNWIA
jgi:hypothetical protein